MTKKTTKKKATTAPAELAEQAASELPSGKSLVRIFDPMAVPPPAKAASLSISLAPELNAKVQELRNTLTPGVELGVSQAVSYLVKLGLAAHAGGWTAAELVAGEQD